MKVGHRTSESLARREGAAPNSVAEILRLLSTGVSGAILLALDEGAMQSKVLTHRVRGYTARTIYRYLSRLAHLGAVERDERLGGRGRVVHALSNSGGGELSELISRYARASMMQLPDGQIDPRAWASLGLLADFWEAGVVEELSHGPRSQAELARRCAPLSYHQLSRRAVRFKTSGYFDELRSGDQGRRYVLTDTTRRTMAVIAGLSQWRRRHLEVAGLTAEEMATVLRVALPLAMAPAHVGKRMQIRITEETRGSVSILEAAVTEAGSVQVQENLPAPPDAEVEGAVADWSNVLVGGDLSVRMGGDLDLVGDCFASLHRELWEPDHRLQQAER